MITFFRTKHIAEQLKNNSVPESHQFLYLTIPILSGMLIPIVTGRDGIGDNNSILPYDKILIYAFGMLAMWFINSRGDNRDFLTRFICLSFPAYIKINILGFAYSFFTIIWHQLDLDMETRRFLWSAFFFFTGILFYILVGFWMKYVSNKQNSGHIS